MDGQFDDALTGEQKIRNFNLNFGPQHPAAHGVLRLVLELDGEIDAETVSASIRDNRDTLIQLSLGEGDSKARFWTTDLTAEYVRLNADYHT